jgi:uncharacterized protein (DUF58 family)
MAVIDLFRRRHQTAAPPPVQLEGVASHGDQMTSLFDEALLAQLRRLTLMSKRSVAEGLAGEHRSRRKGASPEFADFKSYSQGDDFRRIDWNIYSRLDEVFVRLSEVTTELSVHLLLDASNSMDWSSSPTLPTKYDYARRVAGALGYVALWHFDRLVIAPFGSELGKPFGPSQGRSQIMPMLQFLTAQPTLGTTNLADALKRYALAHRRPGILLIVSDLLSGEPSELQESLRFLRSRGWRVTIAHVIDAAELDPVPQGDGSIRLMSVDYVDLEDGSRLRVTPTSDVLEQYREAAAAWRQEIERVCESEQCDYLALQSDWPLESVVLGLLYQRGLIG